MESFFLPVARSKKKKWAPTPTPMEQRLRKPKPCVTLAPNRVQPNRANNVNVTALRQTTFHKAIGNTPYAGRLSLHVPIVAVVSASEICCPERLPAGDLAILTGAAANEAPSPSPEARSGRRRLVSGTAQCPTLAAIADCYSRAHQSGPRAREAALGLGACPALTRPPPCTVSSQPSTCAYCDCSPPGANASSKVWPGTTQTQIADKEPPAVFFLSSETHLRSAALLEPQLLETDVNVTRKKKEVR
jgi:hypothetical protein